MMKKLNVLRKFPSGQAIKYRRWAISLPCNDSNKLTKEIQNLNEPIIPTVMTQ